MQQGDEPTVIDQNDVYFDVGGLTKCLKTPIYDLE
jgi:hypothetical protein